MARSATKAKPSSEKQPIERIEHEGLLDVRNLTTYFKLGVGDVKAVQDVSFTVAPGESLGLAGGSIRPEGGGGWVGGHIADDEKRGE